MTTGEVHAWAEARYAVQSFETEDEIVNEVLAALDLLDINLTTTDDIPTFLRVLEFSVANKEQAFEMLAEYAESIDLESRKARCSMDPFYARFAR